MLLFVQILFAGSLTFVRDNLFLIPAITLFSLLQVLVASTSMLALSSMSKSSRFVGVMYAGLIFFTSALFNAIRGITGRTSFAWISPTETLDQLGHMIFRLQPNFQLSPAVAVLALIVLDCRLVLDPRAAGARRGGGAVSGVGARSRSPVPGHAGAADQRRNRSTETRGAIVQATQLSKWYGQVSGLNDVTAAIPPGSPGLLGPNGAGKSTFMKLMTGQLKPSKGTITVFGEPVWSNPGVFCAHRLLSRAGRLLRPHDRTRVGDRAGAA